jgi:predicted Abi (CAAX) family protease
MNETGLNQFWNWLGGILALNPQTFEQITIQPRSAIVVAIVVLVAGLSQSAAQSIILFINGVKPLRFAMCLLLNAILFGFGYFFLVCSTSFISLSPFFPGAAFGSIARTLGYGYAPLIFSFFGALPYFGMPILAVLSLWHLLAMVVGLSVVLQISVWQAFGAVGFGWVTLQILERTIGQPLAEFGDWLTNQVAGVNLITQQHSIMELFQQRLRSWGSSNRRTSRMKRTVASNRRWQRSIKRSLSLLTLGVITFIVMMMLSPVQAWWFGWSANLSTLLKLVFDLSWIGVIGLVVAGLLAPLEALGWWAGWYSEQVQSNPAQLRQPSSASISRYVIYLDGIGQSTFEFLPDIQAFLDQLGPILPTHVRLVKDQIMPYSVRNIPLIGDRPFAFFWRFAERLRLKNPASIFGYLVNIRNILVVGVSADQRYGPIYNLGIAQVIYESLLRHGYEPSSRVPITLIGFSGGGQMAAGAAPFLKQALKAPIDLISLAGVISGNVNVLQLEHLYHLAGDKDPVERLGPIMFPGRWRPFFLSYWNRAKRMGKVSFVSMGAVGHQLPGGLMDAQHYLPDGRSFLQQTIDNVSAILNGSFPVKEHPQKRVISSYERYQQAAFNQPQYYPLNQTIDKERYHPIAPWMGRLILPKLEDRSHVQGALFEIHHTDEQHAHLVGQIVNLRWSHDPSVQAIVRAVTQDVHFNAEAEYSMRLGRIHPERINHWRQVDPLESLAGSRPNDDVIVMLADLPIVEEIIDSSTINLYISREPVQITGRFYAVVQFLSPLDPQNQPPEQFRVVHFNRKTRQFDGVEETVLLPHVIANGNGVFPSTSDRLEQSPLNETGWYIYGTNDRSGQFVVQSLAPRSLFRLQPDRVIPGKKAAWRYLKRECWTKPAKQKGKISSVLLNPASENTWQEGDQALVIHLYGGIGGKKREPAAKTPIYFGHFAYGVATIIHDPLSDELRFDIHYHQVYTHNIDGIIAGTLHWSCYMGDRQFGWLGTRPVGDLLARLDEFTEPFDVEGSKKSGLFNLVLQLDAMAARYRIGSGTGGTYVGPANNCAQDANQALYASIRGLETRIRLDRLESWLRENPDQVDRFDQLLQLAQNLKQDLLPFDDLRPDWENQEYRLGLSWEEEPLRRLMRGLGSWRTLLPQWASDTIARNFLNKGASVWVLRTNQVGGLDPDIEPVAPS